MGWITKILSHVVVDPKTPDELGHKVALSEDSHGPKPKETSTPFEPADLAELIMYATEEIAGQNARDAVVLQMYWGLTDDDFKTLEDIGVYFGLSRERIRQLKDRAIRRLQSLAKKPGGACREAVSTILTYVQPSEPEAVNRAHTLITLGLPHLSTYQATNVLLAFIAKSGPQFESEKVLRQTLEGITKATERAVKAAYRAAKAAERNERWKDSMMRGVIWPPNGTKTKPLERMTPVREVNKKERSGSFMSNKNNRPVLFESSMEASFFRRLEELPSVISYCEQPCWIPLESGYYCPDCLINLDDGTQILVEIKPWFLMPLYKNQLKWNALGNFANARGVGHLMIDGNKSLHHYQQHIPPADYRSAVLEALMSGPLEWRQYRILKERLRPSRKDFTSLVLREQLVWSLGPFRLAAPGEQQQHPTRRSESSG